MIKTAPRESANFFINLLLTKKGLIGQPPGSSMQTQATERKSIREICYHLG